MPIIWNRTQLEGHEIRLGGTWEKVANVAGPKRPQFGAKGSFYHVTLCSGVTIAGRFYPDWLHIWRGDELVTRKA